MIRWGLLVIAACGPAVPDASDGGQSTAEDAPPYYTYCDDELACGGGLECLAGGSANSLAFTMCSSECLAPVDCPDPPAGWEVTCIHPYGADEPANTGDGGGPVDPADGGWLCALECDDDDACPAGMDCYHSGTFIGDLCQPLRP